MILTNGFRTALAVALFASLPAQAQWDKILNKKTRTLITCAQDSIDVLTIDGGEPETIISKGKTSESLRTSWMTNGIEYRSSEYRGFSEDGAIVTSTGKSTATIRSETAGDLVTEFGTVTQDTEYLDRTTGNVIRRSQREMTSEVTYRVVGQTRMIVRSLSDGKEIPTRGAVEVTTIIDDKTKMTKMTEVTPYIDQQDGYKYETQKSNTTCIYKILD